MCNCYASIVAFESDQHAHVRYTRLAHNLHAGSYLAMRSVEAIVCELTAVNASIAKRSKMDSKASDNLLGKAARQIAYAISNLSDVDFQSAQKLCAAINKADMSDEATTLMNTAVDGKLDARGFPPG